MLGWWVGMTALANGVSPASSSVPATGRQEVVIDVERFGRFSVMASSPQGTAVQLVDRMSGPGPVQGAAGRTNGRIDGFLEAGQTKVVALSDDEGTGQASVEIVRSEELQRSPVRLVPGRLAEADLRDHQQRSYWVETEGAGSVSIEAVGRHVADLRLWADGSWLVDATPRCDVVEPREGQPQRRCRFHVEVPAGLWLATVYGGASEPWSEQSDAAPMAVRLGVPRLPAAGRRAGQIGPMGFDRVRVPREPDTFHLALPADVRDEDGAVPTVSVGTRSVGPTADVNADPSQRADITEASRLPEVTLSSSSSQDRVVTVRGPVGTPYTLTWFAQLRDPQPLSGDGALFVSTLHAADPADVVPPTGVVWRRTDEGRVIRVASQAVPLSKQARFEARFNLMGPTEILVEAEQTGPYVISVAELRAKLAIDPLLEDRPRDFEPMKPRSGELEVELDQGLHLLRILPDEPGIVTLRMAHDSWGSWLKRRITGKEPAAVLRPSVQFSDLNLDRGASVVLGVFRDRRVASGVAVRPLPLKATDGLPLALMPGESVSVGVQIDAPSHLSARTVAGVAIPVEVDGTPISRRTTVQPGLRQVTVRNLDEGPVSAVLQVADPDPRGSLPALSQQRLSQLPTFPRLGIGSSQHVELTRGGSATFLIEVPRDGLYRVQSTGLLATAGAMRTRVRTGFAQGSQNGVGRNFEVASYLRSGTYQVTVQAQGASAGPAGVQLSQATVQSGGTLLPDVPARITLPAHQGVRYTFELPTDSRVRLRSEGTTGSFRCRLMDADDWPLTAPEVPCDRTVTLTAGRYAVLGLPEGVQTRRITTLEVLDDAAAAREGHGPHALQVGQTVTHVWREPIDGSERAPDVWRLDVPAPVDARVSLSDEMVATWMRDGATLGRVVPGQGWSGRLEAGEVELHVTGARRGTGVPYTLRVDSQQLVAGTQRSVSVPARLEVAVGRAQVITLRSAGRTDVAARLFDATGQLVAANDDRPDDWNFQITERLEPGTYALQLEPVGRRGGSAVVEMLAPDERQEEPLALGQTRTLEGHAGASQLPLRFGSGRDVVVATATADENVGVALEVRVDDAWRGLGTATGRQAQLVARLPEAVSEARLRVWSEDRRGGDIAVQAQALRARPVALGALDVGSGGRFGAVRLGGSEGGVFDLSEARGDVYACPERGAVCGVISTSVVGAGSDGLVLVSRKRVRARRVKLAPGQRRTLRIGSQPQPVALEPGRGPSVVVVRSSAGQAGATFARQVGPSGMAVSTGGTLAVSVDGADRARIWDAQPTGAAMDARVTSMRLSSPSATKLAPGRHALTVPARGSLALQLPGGRHDLEVSLDVGLVVATSEGQVLWADADPLAVRLPAVDKRVWLLNPGASDALARVHVGEAGAQATLAGDAPAERLSARMLTEVLTLSGDAGTLRTSGAVSAVVLAADGRVLRGRAIEVDGPGRVLLAFEPGAALAWIEATAGSGPVTDPGAGRSATVRAGDRVVLEGALQRLKLKATGPAVAHLTVPAPLVASYDAGGEARVEVRQPGESLDLWLADGSGELSLRAFTGAALWGVVQVSTSEPEVIGEGLGAEVLLEPGGSHWFRFEVERAGPVGFGVQARADRVEATVRDDAGIAVARGVVGMVELQPGSYFLQLSQPAGRAPVSARPALAGIEPPAPGPPEDVVKGYVQVADPSD